MVIKTVKETSYSGMVKITTSEDGAFYIRQEYLSSINIDLIYPGAYFEGADEDEILDAAMAAVVEFKAVSYLGRAEQSRFGLTRKLRTKGYNQFYIDQALDYLESKDYLSDTRFANAWVSSRLTNHYEGKSKLKAELAGRGISREVASFVVDDVFEEFDEMEVCEKAYKKFVKAGKTDSKLTSAMVNAGFSLKQLREVKEKLEDESI